MATDTGIYGDLLQQAEFYITGDTRGFALPLKLKINNVEKDIGAAANYIYSTHIYDTAGTGDLLRGSITDTFIINDAMLTAAGFSSTWDITKEMIVYFGALTADGTLTGIYLTVDTF